MTNEDKSYHFSRFFLKPLTGDFAPIIFHKEVLTIGRSETCDVQIENPFLSQIHASIFFREGEFFLTDLNSTNGSFVNESRIKVTKLSVGDVIRFGQVKFQLVPLIEGKKSDPDRTLETENPLLNERMIDQFVYSTNPTTSNVPVVNPPPLPNSIDIDSKTVVHAQLPTVENTNTRYPIISSMQHANQGSGIFVLAKPITPLDLFPELNYSEYIFEENAEGAALDFTKVQPAIEITSFVDDFVISIDYFVASKKKLEISGSVDDNKLLIQCLGKNQKSDFLKYQNNSFYLKDLHEELGFDIAIYNKNGVVKKTDNENNFIKIELDYLITLKKDNYQIVLKYTNSPPDTFPPPFIVFDPFLIKYFLYISPIYLFIILVALFAPVQERDWDEQKIEIDRILYVPEPPPPTPIPTPPPARSEEPVKSEVAQSAGEIVKQRKVDIPETVKPKTKEKDTAVSIPPIQNKEIKKPTNPPMTAPKDVPTSKVTQAKAPVTEAVRISEDAIVETAPRLDIKSLQNKFAKRIDTGVVGSNIVSNKSSDALEGPRSLVGSNDGSQVRDVAPLKSDSTATVNVLGAKTGDLGVGKNIPSSLGGDIKVLDGSGGRKVILGIMDPRDVQNILRRYLPQFQFCYEKELERLNQKVATTLILEFVIDLNGRASGDKYSSKNMDFSPQALSCFSKVLTGIQFNKPKGGGIVKIRQPLNMEPR